MREILFRGKCKTDNEWLYGFPYVTRKYAVKINWYCSEFGSMRTDEVSPETVEQFTGLTDKNGTKIFEGDIVKDEQSGYEYVIKWFSEYACFALENKNGHMEYDVDEFEMLVNDLIVVSNIHDDSAFWEVSE